MSRKESTIPVFALFGDEERGRFDDLVHGETVHERSSRYDWEIRPHRHPALCQMLLLADGRVDLVLGQHRTTYSAPMLVVVPSGEIHGFRFLPQSDGFVLTLSDRFVRDFADDDTVAAFLSRPTVIEPDTEVATRLNAIALQIVLAQEAMTGRDLLRRALAEAFIRLAAESDAGRDMSQGDALVRRFQLMVQKHLAQEHQLPFYADRLGCTLRTLSRRVTAALGVSPAQYLHTRLASEATRLLGFTNASCSDVANELGFADPSYFSRFYARMTGIRPSEIRGSQIAPSE